MDSRGSRGSMRGSMQKVPSLSDLSDPESSLGEYSQQDTDTALHIVYILDIVLAFGRLVLKTYSTRHYCSHATDESHAHAGRARGPGSPAGTNRLRCHGLNTNNPKQAGLKSRKNAARQRPAMQQCPPHLPTRSCCLRLFATRKSTINTESEASSKRSSVNRDPLT